jgi:hypothetical protein
MMPVIHRPITDLDARFVATLPIHTHNLMEALRQAEIYFDVTVNGPKDDTKDQSYDIFWFRKDDDMEKITSILRATIPN